jgi:uncharacterized protein (DUF58 family)
MQFYPARRAVFAAALGIPVALLVALAAPSLWTIGPAWSLCAILLMVLDVALAARAQGLSLAAKLPEQLGVGRAALASFTLTFLGREPRSAQMELEGNNRFAISPPRRYLEPGDNSAGFELTPLRRGEGRLERLWLRWTGPMGLAWVQRVYPLGRSLPILPDIRTVQEEVTRLFRRDDAAGVHFQINRGVGTEFHALRDFQAGHDRRLIDWKQSARHRALMVKEYRMEKNQHIVAVLDTGRLMSEPLLGQPRLDRALHAILLLAYVGLKLGDRVGLFAFDSRPRLSSGTLSGVGAFAALQRLAAGLDYSDAETNFTLGLTQLSGELEFRSTIVIFTDFSDTTSAELMLENVARLLRRHSLLFVVFRDEELERMRRDEPLTAQDAVRAVIADKMLKERDIVLARLRQLGVHLVDVPAEKISAGVISSYLAMKQNIRWQP